jgi:ribonuclease P/MRP protein subunit RPP1
MNIINTTSIEEARKQIEKLSKENKEVVVLGQDEDFNRKILENKKVNVLLSPENNHNKDKLYEQDSGLNHILAKIARESNITIGIDIQRIKQKERKEQGKILARIKQNIKLCKKYRVKIKAFNFHDKLSTFSLLLVLGADTKTAGEAVN